MAILQVTQLDFHLNIYKNVQIQFKYFLFLLPPPTWQDMLLYLLSAMPLFCNSNPQQLLVDFRPDDSTVLISLGSGSLSGIASSTGKQSPSLYIYIFFLLKIENV